MVWWSQNLAIWWLEIHMVRWVILHIVRNLMPGLFGYHPRKPECLVPTVKHGARSVMIWAAISSNLLVLYLLWMGKLLPVTTWTFKVARCILWFRCCFLTMLQFFKTIHHTHSQMCSVLVWGAWKSSLASTIDHLKYHRTTVVSFREQGEKQIPSIISQATRRRVVHYFTRDYSVSSKKDTSCVTDKWWPNSILIKKCVSFTTVSIIFVHPPYMLPS